MNQRKQFLKTLFYTLKNYCTILYFLPVFRYSVRKRSNTNKNISFDIKAQCFKITTNYAQGLWRGKAKICLRLF